MLQVLIQDNQPEYADLLKNLPVDARILPEEILEQFKEVDMGPNLGFKQYVLSLTRVSSYLKSIFRFANVKHFALCSKTFAVINMLMQHAVPKLSAFSHHLQKIRKSFSQVLSILAEFNRASIVMQDSWQSLMKYVFEFAKTSGIEDRIVKLMHNMQTTLEAIKDFSRRMNECAPCDMATPDTLKIMCQSGQLPCRNQDNVHCNAVNKADVNLICSFVDKAMLSGGMRRAKSRKQSYKRRSTRSRQSIKNRKLSKNSKKTNKPNKTKNTKNTKKSSNNKTTASKKAKNNKPRSNTRRATRSKKHVAGSSSKKAK